jgi:hypothetical protein
MLCSSTKVAIAVMAIFTLVEYTLGIGVSEAMPLIIS